jgi:hypothetical protein
MANPKGQNPPAHEPDPPKGPGPSDTVHDLPTFDDIGVDGRPVRRTEVLASPRARSPEPPTVRRPAPASLRAPESGAGVATASPPPHRPPGPAQRPPPAGPTARPASPPSGPALRPAEAPRATTPPPTVVPLTSEDASSDAAQIPTVRRPAPVVVTPHSIVVPVTFEDASSDAAQIPTLRRPAPVVVTPPSIVIDLSSEDASRDAADIPTRRRPAPASAALSTAPPSPTPPTARVAAPPVGTPPARAARMAPTLIAESPVDAAKEAISSRPVLPAEAPGDAVDTPFRTARTVAMEALSEPPEVVPLRRDKVPDAPISRPVGPPAVPAPGPLDEPARIGRGSHKVPRRNAPRSHEPGSSHSGAGLTGGLAVGLIGLSFLLPTAEGPPWERVLYPTGATFHALALLLAMAALWLARPGRRGHIIGHATIAVIAATLAWLSMRDAVAAGLFDAQPALDALWGGSGLAGLAVALGTGAVTGAAVARGQGSGLPSAITYGVGFLLLLVPPVFLPVEGHGTALSGLLSALGDAPFRGDRVAAFALLPAVVVVVAGLPLLRPSLLRGGGSLLALLLLVTLAVPLIVLALYVAPSAAWEQTLAPLKAVLLLVGGAGVVARAVAVALAPPPA